MEIKSIVSVDISFGTTIDRHIDHQGDTKSQYRSYQIRSRVARIGSKFYQGITDKESKHHMKR